MAVDDAGDMNVFLSPRVGFSLVGEPPPVQSQNTSLLTFADMVLALDHKSCEDNLSDTDGSLVLESKPKTDHTYATRSSGRVTRSQSQVQNKKTSFCTTQSDKQLKTQQVQRDSKENRSRDIDDASDYDKNSVEISEHKSVSRSQTARNKRSVSVKKEKSSSVENLQSQSYSEEHVTDEEWPQAMMLGGSPRKSCSFEEVGCDKLGPRNKSMVSSKSSENVERGNVSGQLHRLVNDTLEFPCWPRKADHTYATATWDGTAASHSLFEQEMRQDEQNASKSPEDEEMEEMEHTYSVKGTDCHHGHSTMTEPSLALFHGPLSGQKDDHTYVKPHAKDYLGSVETNSSTSAQSFSSSTFPRQKTREDHTYFHSGLSKKDHGLSGGREWASTHTMTQWSESQDMQIEEAYRNLNSLSQSASAKKDHNYSTSA